MKDRKKALESIQVIKLSPKSAKLIVGGINDLDGKGNDVVT